MATLILTTVGNAIGGPVGGAIGALMGRSVDALLVRPKRREGPRLTELAVQTSSYGSQIPRLFGTMRVAGTVIWATDLIESRATSGGGKGQPGTATYSYAASFAVLLSARRVVRIGRIWAEGKLLRGAGGDFKTATGFRLHAGGEDQPVDPLIASAEGAGMAPAHRGCAYVVFERMALADYGNRIPSLTFEVIADEGPVAVGAIASAVAQELVEAGSVPLMLEGYAAAGGSVGAVLASLAQASGAWFVAEGAGLVMRGAGGSVVRIVDEGVGAGAAGPARTRTVAAIETVPRTLSIGHYDPAREYQAGLQRVRRPGAGVRDERIEVAAVMTAGAAKTIATGMMARAEAERVRRTVRMGFAGMALTPGTCVVIEGEGEAVWRIVESSIEAMVTTLVLVPVEPAPLPVRASGGRVLGAVDAVIGATVLVVFETPGLGDAPLVAPRLSVAACGTGAGWRQAALLYSLDDGASWIAGGGTAAPAVIGRVVGVAGAAPATLVDEAGAFEVVLARGDMVLADADAAGLDGGRNLAIVGDELIQFGRAVPLGGGRWRLTRLLRGRRGTEAAIGTQEPDARFVLIEAETVRGIDLPVTALGQGVRVMASGVGDAVPVEARILLSGASVRPPSPVALSVVEAGGGDAVVRWVRRSRAGWRWIDGGDVPLGEDAEIYAVRIGSGAAVIRHVDTSEPRVTVSAVERARGAVSVEIRQRGIFGVSDACVIGVPSQGETL